MAEIGNVTVRVDVVITDEQYREAMGAVRAANERMDLLEAENAKLRELACILAWCAVGADCDKCPINTLDFSEWPNGREICYSADDRMRELGVEMDG